MLVTKGKGKAAAAGLVLALALAAAAGGAPALALNPAAGSTNTGQSLTVAISAPAAGTRVGAGPGTVLVTGTAAIGPLLDSGNVMYVVDVSGSTSYPSGKDCNGDGVLSPLDDVNGDGSIGDTLDCEVAGVIALNASLASAPGAEAGLAIFGSVAAITDIGPAEGQQTFTSPLTADADQNGQADIADVAKSLRFNGTVGRYTYKMAGTGTNFDAALGALATAFTGREGEHNFAFFLSDGQAPLKTDAGSPLSQVVAAGIKVNTYSVGGFSTGCGPTANLRRIAEATGGTCTEVRDPSMLTSVLVTPATIAGVSVSVNGGTPVAATVSGSDWSAPVAGLQGGVWNTITAAVTASDGATATADVRVYGNRAPTANAGGPYTVAEGSAITLHGMATDPDGDALSIAWSPAGRLTNAGTPTPTFLADDSSAAEVTLHVADPYGLTADATATVTVVNVAPTVESIAAPTAPLAVGTPVTITAPFTDPGTLDTHTATWDWGDGTTTSGTVTEEAGDGTVADSHVYTQPGIYTVTLTIRDDDGGQQIITFHYIVAYDPNGGFVTGGGWYNAPGGKATFGLNAKYKQGATLPDGQTEFKVGDLSFHSTRYEWLVLSGARAQYRGRGTVNGAGDYSFTVTVVDGDRSVGGPDLIRMKIWDPATGAVLYDSQPGAPDDAQPATALGSGSIVVH